LRAATIPLQSDLVQALRGHKPDGAKPQDRVFTGIPTVDTLRRDLEYAGIDYGDAAGRVFDFHASRPTFGTLLSVGGVSPRSAQSLMRHSDINMTMLTYTDPRLLDLGKAVESMPDSASPPDAQRLRAIGTSNHQAGLEFVPEFVPAAGKPRENGASGDNMTSEKPAKSEKRRMAEKDGLDNEFYTLASPDIDSGRSESNRHNQLGRLGLYR